MVWMPDASASSRIRSSKTVFPTPRNPTIRMLFAGRPARTLANATLMVSRNSSRPASSGGGVPAPGAYGFLTGSMNGYLYAVFIIYNATINSTNRIKSALRRCAAGPAGSHGGIFTKVPRCCSRQTQGWSGTKPQRGGDAATPAVCWSSQAPYAFPIAFSMKSGRSTLFQSGAALIRLASIRISACFCMYDFRSGKPGWTSTRDKAVENTCGVIL
jgi:hypothetical protein